MKNLVKMLEDEQYDEVAKLINEGADVNVYGGFFGGNTPLIHQAVQEQQIDLVKLIIAKGLKNPDVFEKDDPYNKQTTAIQIAAKKGDLDIFNLLLNAGADVNNEGNYKWLMLEAVSGGNYDIVKKLIDLGLKVDVDEKGNSSDEGGDRAPLHCLHFFHQESNENKTKIAELLIANGADVNGRNPDGETPLWLSAEANDYEITKLLLDNGADKDLKDFRTYKLPKQKTKNAKIKKLLA